MQEFVSGTCEDLCPESEKQLRTRERLLHFYELRSGQKNVPGILVKSFSRSAAGVKSPRKKDLRTESALQRTVSYLLKSILIDKRKSYNYVYDFVFDRFRAVRQEIVMQNYNASQIIKLVEPMIMFLAYSRYRLCEESRDKFDPKICDQHLQECLKLVLCCYDEITQCNDQQWEDLKLNEIRNRSFIESLYQVFNLGSMDALNRCIQLPKELRKDSLFEMTYSVAINYYQGNYYRVVSGISRLPHILSAIASLKLQRIRRELYHIFSHAYSSRQLTVPIDWMCRLFLYSPENEMFKDFKNYNLEISSDSKSVKFFKSDFQVNNEALIEKHEEFVEIKLKRIYLPEVLLLKRL